MKYFIIIRDVDSTSVRSVETEDIEEELQISALEAGGSGGGYNQHWNGSSWEFVACVRSGTWPEDWVDQTPDSLDWCKLWAEPDTGSFVEVA